MARQARALAVAAARELGWGLRGVSAEVAGWHARAQAIPDPALRCFALRALVDKRPLLDGAALFWTLPDRRQPELLRLLVAFQALANFHDYASERAGLEGGHGPGSSMLAFLEVVDIDRPLKSYYGEGADAMDGGYLHALASTCRAAAAHLPRYGEAREMLMEQARRARSLDLEHDVDPCRRCAALQCVAASEFPRDTDATWWELTAGASSLLGVIVLLALAADESSTRDDLREAAEAYIWVGTASGLLDSYVDQLDDKMSGSHNYLGYYSSPATAVECIAALVARALRDVSALRNGERHLVIVASMTAMYLSNDRARSAPLRGSTAALAASSGTLTRLLIPILRAWRIAYREPVS